MHLWKLKQFFWYFASLSMTWNDYFVTFINYIYIIVILVVENRGMCDLQGNNFAKFYRS